jgi:ferritin-like metal-binding protein YciE
MAMQSLEDLFVDKLKDVHDAEKRITRALPKLIRAASSEELSNAFEKHLQETERQVDRLEQIFGELGKTPGRKTCHGIMGILEEGEEVMDKDAPEAVMDAALIAAAQEVEHYEISAYGCLKTWAEVLGKQDLANLLRETLQEEEKTDATLSRLASTINAQARDGAESEHHASVLVPARRGGNGSTRSSGGRSQKR